MLTNNTKKFCAKLYDSNNINELEWPDNAEGQYGKCFLEPFVKDGIRHYIENIHAEIFILKVDEFVFPVIVPVEFKENSYVCSPYQHYITYGKQNVDLISSTRLLKVVKSFMEILDKAVKAGRLDAVVYVNNWLFSTDLYPSGLTSEHFKAILELLQTRFEKRAIVFRSLNQITNAQTIISLKETGFQMIASRNVFVSNAKNEAIFKTRIFKSDLKLMAKSPYKIVDHPDLALSDCEQFCKLRTLFANVQHSFLQPKMSQGFIEHLFNHNLIRFQAVKLNEEIKGVIGHFKRDGTMFCPFIAFDKEGEDQAVIYRLLSTTLMLEAQKDAQFFNQSAGASFYKSVRRAEGTMEFMAVYTRHLPFKQKIAWSSLKHSMNTLGAYYMKRF